MPVAPPQVHSSPQLIAYADRLGEDVHTLQRTGDSTLATLRIHFTDLSHRLTSVIGDRHAAVDDLMTLPEISAWDPSSGSAS